MEQQLVSPNQLLQRSGWGVPYAAGSGHQVARCLSRASNQLIHRHIRLLPADQVLHTHGAPRPLIGRHQHQPGCRRGQGARGQPRRRMRPPLTCNPPQPGSVPLLQATIGNRSVRHLLPPPPPSLPLCLLPHPTSTHLNCSALPA